MAGVVRRVACLDIAFAHRTFQPGTVGSAREGSAAVHCRHHRNGPMPSGAGGKDDLFSYYDIICEPEESRHESEAEANPNGYFDRRAAVHSPRSASRTPIGRPENRPIKGMPADRWRYRSQEAD